MFATILLLVSGCNRERETGLNPGDLAPDFRALDLDGVEHSLSNYRGKVVLLNFWSTWCGPCQREMPALERLHNRLREKGFIVLAVALDDLLENIQEFKRQYGLSFSILYDNSGKLKRDYRLGGFPESFIIDRLGKLVMIIDPEDRVPVVRIVGPRAWDSPEVVGAIEGLLDD